jgi:CO dehydrogenase/acetyl-CoA synthase gamma subunit (corrinoid Fe-S protein)
MDLLKYFPRKDCGACPEGSCKSFLDNLKGKRANIQDCPWLTPSKRYALDIALRGEEILPKITVMEVPRAGFTGLYELNEPGEKSPVIVTGNSEITEEVIFTIFSLTVSPFYLVFVNSLGDTVDMAMIKGTFTAEIIIKGLKESFGNKGYRSHTIVIPGFSLSIVDILRGFNLYNVQIGPICAAELPLFMGDLWGPPP